MCQNVEEDRKVYNDLLEYIAEDAKVDLEELKTRQTYPLPCYRYGAIWYLYKVKGWGWSRIGRATGKSHVTAKLQSHYTCRHYRQRCRNKEF